jgi:hypothetical protein
MNETIKGNQKPKDEYQIPPVGTNIVVCWEFKNGRRINKLDSTTIKAIGKKWVTLENGEKFAIGKRWIMDGGQYNSPGECFPDMACYEERVLRLKFWNNIRVGMGFTPPEGVSLVDIEQAAKLLGINIGGGL